MSYVRSGSNPENLYIICSINIEIYHGDGQSITVPYDEWIKFWDQAIDKEYGT